jgi:thiamine-phosphate pyrophosphorylase
MRLGVPLIINDRVDSALAANADGSHVGQNDLPAEELRHIIGPGKIIGVSVSTEAEAIAAADAGADYLGVGAMYATGTKGDAHVTSMEELRRIRRVVTLPIVAIGGINKNTVPDFYGTGIDGLAVVSAIVAEADVCTAARELKELFLKGKAPHESIYF